MKPTVAGILAVLIVLTILVICVARRARRPAAAPAPSSDPPPRTLGGAMTCANSKVAANIRMMVGANDQAPGACRMSADGAWLLYPKAWAEVPGSEISGSPKNKVTSGTCASFCASDPNCAAWVNDPATYCRAYSVVPGALVGNDVSNVGLKSAALM